MPYDTIVERLQTISHSAQTCQQNRAVILTTHDRDHAWGLLRRVISNGEPLSLYRFSLAERQRYQPGKLAFEPCGGPCPDPAQLIRAAMEVRPPAVVVMEDVLFHVRDEGGDPTGRSTLITALSHETRPGGRLFIFLEPPENEQHLPALVEDQTDRVQVQMPVPQDLERVAREEMATHGGITCSEADLKDLEQWAPRLAAGLSGLTISTARNTLRDALLATPRDFKKAEARLMQEKGVRLAHELSMNLLDTSDVDLPIGLDYLYSYLRVHRRRIAVPGRDRARGILLIGPPGTGKTMLARAIGKILTIPTVEFNIGALISSYLGETEHRFQRAFETLDALSPAVVFIDEFEKAFGGDGERGGGETMTRCKGRLHSWLSDSPAPNFIVATANDLERLGQDALSLTRKGRFDRAFYVGFPSRSARRQILIHLLKGRMPEDLAQETAERIAETTDRFTGADLCAAINEAVAQVEHEQRTLAEPDLLREVEKNRLRVQLVYERYMGLKKWADMYCEPAGPEGDE